MCVCVCVCVCVAGWLALLFLELVASCRGREEVIMREDREGREGGERRGVQQTRYRVRDD